MPTSDTEFARQLLARLKQSPDAKAKDQDAEAIFPGTHQTTCCSAKLTRIALEIRVAPEAVFGFFMTNGLMRDFKEKVTDHCRKLIKIPVRFQPTYDPEANQRAQEQIEKMIDASGLTYSADFVHKNDKNKPIAFPRRLEFRCSCPLMHFQPTRKLF